jgi:hypothetical protein
MMIGPSFSEELAAAGLLGLPFAWGTDGRIEYGPEITDEQRKSIEAVLQAHDGAASQARHDARVEAMTQAAVDIAALFGKPARSLDLVFTELNVLAEAISLVDKEKPVPEETARLDALKKLWADVKAIRARELASEKR